MRSSTLRGLTLEPAGWGRRVLCMVYESLIVVALVLAGGLLALVLPSEAKGVAGLSRFALQVWIGGLISAYFAGCWWRFGQTLAMKTWRLVVTTQDGAPLTLALALKRLLMAAMTLPLSVAWPLFDRDRLCLHDRLAGTRVWRIIARNGGT